ncbi:MAG: hypothetical protein U9N49_10675 [Campylobacterota bacterium]|nr:hypothetical protein [Campylobacterota bacterium]
MDRLLELSDHNTIKEILFDYAYIWKLLEEKLIFVTPLLFTQYNSALDAYNKVYEPDSLSNTHITIPVPDPTNLVFWKQFISIRAKMDDLKLNAQKINKLVEISGGLLRGTLVVLRHLLNLMYRDGDIVVKEKHIIKLQEDVKVSLRNLQSSLSPQEFEKIAFIDKHKPSQIPNGALSLFARDIPLVLFTQREEKTMCVIHPLIDLNEIPF